MRWQYGASSLWTDGASQSEIGSKVTFVMEHLFKNNNWMGSVNLRGNHCIEQEREDKEDRGEEEVALCNPDRPWNGNLSFRCSILRQKKR